jgi:UDP-N-acetylglucosamine:LPS N-acetylglucosamine transferase
VLFGGQGSMQMLKIARLLGDRQLILMSGHNAPLAEQLRSLRRKAPHAVLGFTREVGKYMALADWFVGKPGPGSLSEAVQMGLPVITFSNAWTMPQERFNTRWVREQGVGLVVPSLKALPAAVDELLADLCACRARVRAIRNQAVYEVPQILAERLMRSAMPAPTARLPHVTGELS